MEQVKEETEGVSSLTSGAGIGDSEARRLSIPDLTQLSNHVSSAAVNSRSRMYMEEDEEIEPVQNDTHTSKRVAPPPKITVFAEDEPKSPDDSDSPGPDDVLSPMTFASISHLQSSPDPPGQYRSLQETSTSRPPPAIRAHRRSISEPLQGPMAPPHAIPLGLHARPTPPSPERTPRGFRRRSQGGGGSSFSGAAGSFTRIPGKLRDLFHAAHTPVLKDDSSQGHDDGQSTVSFYALCSEGGHTQDSVRRCLRLLKEDKRRARVKGPGGKLPLHLLCEAPNHTSHSVEICNALLKTYKKGAKTKAGTAGGDYLPVHLLCLNERPTEHSEAILRLVIHAYEDGVEKPGTVMTRKVLPISMISEGRVLSPHSVKMFKRILEVNKENVKLKGSDGKTLLHRLCLSTKHLPHTECTMGIVQLILDVHRRAPEVQDQNGHRALHILAQSEALTVHSVSIASLLLKGSEQVAGMPDKSGQLALHYLCSCPRLTQHSQELCRLLLEYHEKGAQTQNQEGRLPLHLVCASQKLSRQSVDVCRQLLLAHKQGFGAADCNGQLPVHVLCAAMTEHRKGMAHAQDILDQLMWTDRASVEAEDNQRRLPIHVLCAAGLFSSHAANILGQLLKECPRAVSTPDQEGYLPLHLLLQSKPHTAHTVSGFQKLTKVLEGDQRNGAQSKACGGQLPVHCLCGAGWHTAHSVKIFKWLVQQNQDEICTPDATGMTPLHWLCSAWGHSEYSEVIYDELVALGTTGKHGAQIMADDKVLPIHVLCGAGKHTEHSCRMFEKLVNSHPTSLEVRTAKDLSSARKKWQIPMMQRHMSNTSSIFSDRGARGVNDVEREDGRDTGSGEDFEKTPSGHMRDMSETASIGTGGVAVDMDHRRLQDGPAGRLPLHFLCGAEDHTESSVEICKQLLQRYAKGVTVSGEDGMLPLHLLCTARALTKHSVEVCALVVEKYEHLTTDEELDLRPLLLVCQSQSLSAHSVHTCKILLESQGRQQARRRMARRASMSSAQKLKWLPLHDLCRSDMHTEHSAEICKQFLNERQDWASTPDDDGFLPLHALCAAPKHTKWSLEIASQLLVTYPHAVEHEGGSDKCRPLHVVCKNTNRSEHSVAICELLLRGKAAHAAQRECASGLRPLHLLCSQPAQNESCVKICAALIKAFPQACSMPGHTAKTTREGSENDKGSDRDLPLHRLCRAEPHSEYSVKMCEQLVNAYHRGLYERGNAHYLDDDEAEDKNWDDPLMTVCKGDMLNKHSSRMCPFLVTPDHQNLKDALETLSQKVYRPKGNEELQKMALRIVIRLSFVAGDIAVKYIDLDESNSGPHSLKFMKTVVDELGLDSENPLHHVLRVAQLYKTLSAKETCTQLVARLEKMSNTHLEWAADMVEMLPSKVAKRAIWAPEKHSDEFMQGDSPIGIALELGDLKIVSHGAVFDVVREAWPGKYQYKYNPFTGSLYNNLILEYRHSAGTKGSSEREWHFTWKKRFKEILDPNKLIQSPMMMYFLGIVLQTTFLVVFHVVVEQSSKPNDYRWSLGPASWYLVLHAGGGMLYELGQLIGEGLLRYSKDPWNVVDVSMYSLLTIWFVIRTYEASQDLTGNFIPEQSYSIDFLGIAAIFIWLRMLNVFGLDQNFGPLVKVIQGMVLNVVVFLVLLTIFLAGFATSLKCIFKRQAGLNLEAVHKLNLDSYENQAYSMLSLLDMSLGNFALVDLFSVSELAFCVTLVFLACTYIMLFNMLIAMMTDTYTKILVTSEQLWKKDRALLMASYTKTNKMLDRVNLGGILTALPQPLNLLMVTALLIIMPFYLPIRIYMNPNKLVWQNMVNELQSTVIQVILVVFVTLPLSLFFLVFVVPLNWIFVVSPGMFEYMGIQNVLSIPLWAFAGTSQVVGILVTPIVFVVAILSVPVMRVRKQFRRMYGLESMYDTWDRADSGSGHRMLANTRGVEVAGGNFGFGFFKPRQRRASSREFSGRSMVAHLRRNSDEDLSEIHWDADEQAQYQSVQSRTGESDKGLEIWEEDLDDDDKSALRAMHRDRKPKENLDDGTAEAVMSKEELAFQELRVEMSRKIAAVDGTQRTLLQTTRDLQIESTLLQQHTSRSLAELEERLMERLDQFDQCGTDPDQVKDVLVAVQQAQAEQLATVQEKAGEVSAWQRGAHVRVERKLEEILATLYECYEPSWVESGIDDGEGGESAIKEGLQTPFAESVTNGGLGTPRSPPPPLSLQQPPRADGLSVASNPSPVITFDTLPLSATQFPIDTDRWQVTAMLASPRGERAGGGGGGGGARKREERESVFKSPGSALFPTLRAPAGVSLKPLEIPNNHFSPKPPLFDPSSGAAHRGGQDMLLPSSAEHPKLRLPGRGRTVLRAMEEQLAAQQAESRRQLELLHERIAAIGPQVDDIRGLLQEGKEYSSKQLESVQQLQRRVEETEERRREETEQLHAERGAREGEGSERAREGARGGAREGELEAVREMMLAMEDSISRRNEEVLRRMEERVEEERARERQQLASVVEQRVQSAMMDSMRSLHQHFLHSVRGELTSMLSVPNGLDNGHNGNANGNANGNNGSETDTSDLASLSPNLSLRRPPTGATPVSNGPSYGPHLDRKEIELLPYAHVQAALFAQAQTESSHQMSFRPWHERDPHLLSQADIDRCVPMYNTWRTFRGLPVPALPDQDEVELRPFAFVRAGMFLVSAECRMPWHEVAVVEDARVPRVTREGIREALDLLADYELDPIGLDVASFLHCWRQSSRTPTPPPPDSE